jgi:hypothetical protein
MYDLAPFSTFYRSFMVSMAEKPGSALHGATVYTGAAGEDLVLLGLDVDNNLKKAGDWVKNLANAEYQMETAIKREGKLWPVEEGDPWWKLSKEQMPEVINAWAANVGDQVPLMLLTMLGRKTGKTVGKPIGASVAAAVGAVTVGPEPSDVVTVPALATFITKLSEHLGGAAPMVAVEAAGFMDYAEHLKIDKDIAETYARWYGAVSGIVEYSQQLFRLKAFRGITTAGQKKLIVRILKEIGGNLFEGVEELTQESLQNWLMGKAIADQKLRNPDFEAVAPDVFEGGGRAFAIGTGVSIVTRGFGKGSVRILHSLSGATKAELDALSFELAPEKVRKKIRAELVKEVEKAEAEETHPVDEEMAEKIQRVVDEAAERPARREEEVDTGTLSKEEVSQLVEAGVDRQDAIDMNPVRARAILGTARLDASADALTVEEVGKRPEVGGEVTQADVDAYEEEFNRRKDIHVKEIIEARQKVPGAVPPISMKLQMEGVAKVREAEVELTEREAAEQLGTSLEQIRFNRDLRDKMSKNGIVITDDIRSAILKKGAPGLTKAEVEHLGKRPQAALRAGQKLGHDIGFKLAEAEGRLRARQAAEEIRLAKKLTKELQKKARELVKAAVTDPKLKKELLLRLKNEVKTADDLRPFAEKIFEGIERAEKKANVKELIGLTKTIKPDKMHKPFARAAKALLESIKVGRMKADTQIRLNAILDYAKAVVDSVHPDSIAAVEAQDLTNRLQKERRKTIGIRELDNQSLRQIIDTLTSIKTMNEQHDSIISEEEAEKVSERQKALKADARANQRPVNETETTAQKIGRGTKNFVGNLHGNLESVSDNVSGGRAGVISLWLKAKNNLTSFVYDVINRGVDEQTVYHRKSREVLRSILKKHGIDSKTIKAWFEAKRRSFEMLDARGNKQTVSFTVNELMAIFMHTRNTHNLDVLRQNGMDRILSGKRKVEIRGFTNEVLDEMIATLSDKQKAIAREVGSRLMDGMHKDALNETSQKLEGRDIATVLNYWPARRSIIREIAGEKIKGVQKLVESMGIFQERTGTGNPLRLSGFFETVYNSNKTIASYVGLAPALRDAKTVFSADVQKEYISSGWGKEVDTMRKFIERIEDNSIEAAPLDTVVKRLIGRFARSRFAINTKIWVRQQLSSLLMFAYVDASHIRAFRGMSNAEIIAEIKALSPQIGARFEGFRFDRDIGDASLENELMEYLTGELDLRDKFLLGMKYFDTNAIVDVYRASLSEITEARPDLKRDSAEFQQLLKERFEWLVRHTQPVWHVKDRSLLGSDPRPLWRSMTMFMSQREQIVRMVTNAAVEYAHSNKDVSALRRLGKVYGAVGMNMALFTLYNTMWALGVKRKKKSMLDVLSEFTQNSFGNLFFGKFASEIIRVYTEGIQKRSFQEVSFESPPLRLLTTAGTGLMQLNLAALHFLTGEIYISGPNRNQKKWKNELWTSADNIADAISGFTGLPYIGPKEIIKGLKSWGEEIDFDFEEEKPATKFRTGSKR